ELLAEIHPVVAALTNAHKVSLAVPAGEAELARGGAARAQPVTGHPQQDDRGDEVMEINAHLCLDGMGLRLTCQSRETSTDRKSLKRCRPRFLRALHLANVPVHALLDRLNQRVDFSLRALDLKQDTAVGQILHE